MDTDTLSYYFKGDLNAVDKVNLYINQYGFVNLSLITYYEVMNGLLYKDAKKQLKSFQQFVDLNRILALDQNIATTAAQIYADLRKAGKMIGHNDVLIGATALEHNMTIITNNTNHFSRIPKLSIDNWVI